VTTRPAPSESPTPNARPIVAVLAFCGIVVSLMQTLVIPLIPELPQLLHTSASNASWVITATLLAGAVITPISGRLGDMFGKRKILMLCLGALIAGSVLCALGSSLVLVVIGRAMQGAAVGAIPLGISILRDELPRERVGSAVATMSATLGVGGAVGLPVAALIAQSTSWHVLFWVSAGLGAVCLALVATVLTESPVRTPARFDAVGALGLAAGLVTLLLAITKGSDWGWGSTTTIGCLVVSLVVLLAWAAFELRTAAPLVDLRVSARPQVLYTNLASVMVGFAMYGMSLTLPQLLMSPTATGYGLGQSMVSAGLALAPAGIVMMLLSPVSAMITARKGPKTTLMTGTVVIAAGYALAFFLTSAVWQIVLASAIIGAGIGLAYASMPGLIMGAVPITETAAANGLNTLMRSVGTSTSAAVMSVVLANMTMRLGLVSLPSLSGFRTTFVIAIAAAGLALVFTALIPTRKSIVPDGHEAVREPVTTAHQTAGVGAAG
jgi:MFS family permease